MAKFRKKPVVIEAWQWNETTALREELERLGMFSWGYEGHTDRPTECRNLRIRTLESNQFRVQLGDYIIRGIKGEFYACKPDIFAATYEPAEGA